MKHTISQTNWLLLLLPGEVVRNSVYLFISADFPECNHPAYQIYPATDGEFTNLKQQQPGPLSLFFFQKKSEAKKHKSNQFKE